MNETELLPAFNGNWSEEAFAALVRRYAGLVYATAKRRLANASLAEDITQIVFIRFAKKPPKVRNPAELAAWLHRTTVNVSIDLWRSETRRRARELQAVIMEPATPETVVWEEISSKLDEAMNQLADEDRHALLLRFFSGKTMREVGTTMGVSEDAAKMRVSRAVERLRTQMGAGAAACTVAVLGALLVNHSVEAAPAQLVTRLSSMKLPAATGMVAAGLLATFFQSSNFKLASGAIVLALLAIVAFRHFHRVNPPLANTTATNFLTASNANADYKQFETFARANHFIDTNTYFHLVDSETRKPLAGGRVHISYYNGSKYVNRDYLTDSRGIATIPETVKVTKHGGVSVTAVVDGYVPKGVLFSYFQEGLRQVPTEYTMDLYPAMTASGIVEDEQGHPVSGVKIIIQDPEIKPGIMFKQEQQVSFDDCPVTNNGDGTWSYSYVPRYFTNQIPFILTKPGYAMTFIVVPVSQVDLNDLVLVINRGFTITGQVTDAQQQPIAKASIKTLVDYPDRGRIVKTDENGLFNLTNVSGIDINNIPQSETIQTNENGELNGVARFSQTASLKTNEYGVVSLHEWKGKYAQSTETAQPVIFFPQATRAIETNGNGEIVVVTNASEPELWDGTNQNGLFAVREWKDTRSVELGVQAKGFAWQTNSVELTQLTNTMNFSLLHGNILRGRVVDEAGNPVAKAHLETPWGNDDSLGTEWQTRTDANGNFEWDSAPAGPILFQCNADGYQPRFYVSLTADGSDHEITLKRVATP